MADALVIIGASVRAAAFSALRGGFQPWCVDLFADADLVGRCPVQRLPGADYPNALPHILEQAPPGPWMYTGALENHPSIVGAIAGQRPLWGNDADVLTRVRSPRLLRELLAKADLPSPEVRLLEEGPPPHGHWLVKPRAGAGGIGIRVHNPTARLPRARRSMYWQEFVLGEPCAAIYIGDGTEARLLGVTHQLVGQGWLHGAPFRYCGSIGPLPLAAEEQQAFEQLGNALAAGCGLRGLFGVDCVMRHGLPWTVEVNPRYTSSVEVLEYALQTAALALHRRVFDASAPLPSIQPPRGVVGKAILFAPQATIFPERGPWDAALKATSADDMPAYADVPSPGETIAAGKPILTFFTQAGTTTACLERLREIALELDGRFSAGSGRR